MKKIILAAVAASIGSSAFAGPLVFSNGVQLTDVQIVERQKEGKLPAIVGNSFYEDGKFVMASDSKNPTVRKVQKVREAIRARQENQDQKRIDRAPAEAARAAAYKAAVEAAEARKTAYEAFINSPLEWSDNARKIFEDGINYSLDNEEYFKTDEGKVFAVEIRNEMENMTKLSASELSNFFYGETHGYTTPTQVNDLVKWASGLEGTEAGLKTVIAENGDTKTVFQNEVDKLRESATYAIKIAAGGYENFDKIGDDWHTKP